MFPWIRVKETKCFCLLQYLLFTPLLLFNYFWRQGKGSVGNVRIEFCWFIFQQKLPIHQTESLHGNIMALNKISNEKKHISHNGAHGQKQRQRPTLGWPTAWWPGHSHGIREAHVQTPVPIGIYRMWNISYRNDGDIYPLVTTESAWNVRGLHSSTYSAWART